MGPAPPGNQVPVRLCALLPDSNRESSPGENASVNGDGVESREFDGAVLSQAVQLKNLKQNRIKGDNAHSKLPYFMKLIHVIATEDEAQSIYTNIEKTPTEMKSSNYETNASKKHESSAKMLKTVFPCVWKKAELSDT